MSLTRMQRDAMVRAQNGDWELADAIEVVARAEATPHDWPLLGGIRQGGRLQFLVYGFRHEQSCSDDSCEGCAAPDFPPDAVIDTVKLVTNLNGDSMWRDQTDNDGYPPPPFDWVDLPLHEAQAAVATYHAAGTRPTQHTLIPEPA